MIFIFPLGQYIITDVWGEPPASTSGWTSSVGSNYVNTCGSETIIGGYGKFEVGSWAEKTYSGLPGHNTISIQWDAYFLDSWDGTNIVSDPSQDSYELLVDGTSQYNLLYETCYDCNGATSSHCIQCTGTYLNLSPQGSCSSSCPDGYYLDIAYWQCRQCYQGSGSTYYTCATCSGGAFNNCNSGNSGSFFYGNGCRNPCPNGYWGDPSTNTCKTCHSSTIGPDFSCATCSGGASNNCNSCNSGSFLYLNKCQSTCPDGFWGDTTTNTCKPCYSSSVSPHYSCATCIGGTYHDCSSCGSGNFLYLSTGGECLDSCPDGFWADTSANKCQPCYSSNIGPYYSCATCTLNGNSNCTSCSTGYFLYPSTGGNCLNACPDRFWGDASENLCQPCYSSTAGPYYSCATCSGGSEQNCNSCDSGTFLYLSRCLSACPDGYWADNSTNTCQLCSLGSVYQSACKLNYTTVPALQKTTTSLSIISIILSATLEWKNSGSRVVPINLLLYLSAIESIKNQQYFNFNHSQITFDAYSGLSTSLIPNWISHFNSLDQSSLTFDYGIFEINQLSSLYLDNFGDTLTDVMIYITICLLGLSYSLITKTPANCSLLSLVRDMQQFLESSFAVFLDKSKVKYYSQLFKY